MVSQILASLIVFLLYFYIFEPLFHELGHALVLAKYENYAAISFYIPFAKKIRIKIGNIDFFNVNNKKFKNITYSKSNFKNLSEQQIINIAKAGVRVSIIHAFIVLGLAVLLRLYFLSVFMLFMFGIFLHAKLFQKQYNDFNIERNPNEFIHRIEKYPKDSPMRYESLIKEYEK